MAGHSQFKNIMHRKGAQDAKKAKIFNKIAREILVACRAGLPDPNANPRLRAALAQARANNMPRERIERAMAAARDTGKDNYEAVRYEGYGPGGVALLVECLTDNRTRTVAEVRAAFGKNGGTLGEPGAVAFMFQAVGLLLYPAGAGTADAMLEAALAAGAENIESNSDGHMITTTPADFLGVRDALEQQLGAALEAKLTWLPTTPASPNAEQQAQLEKLLEVLEEMDDVQQVVSNAA